MLDRNILSRDQIDDEVPGQDSVARRPEDVVLKEFDFTFDKLIKVKYFCEGCEVWITGGRISEMNHVDCEDEECHCAWISRRQLSVLDHLDRCHVNQECEVFSVRDGAAEIQQADIQLILRS